MLFRRGPSMEDVRARLLALVRQAKVQPNDVGDQAIGPIQPGHLPTTISIRINALNPQDLVPEARRILTADVAKRADGSGHQAYLLIVGDGDNSMSDVPPQDVDFYLRLVRATISSWLGASIAVRGQVAITGSFFHRNRGVAHIEAKEWADATSEFRLALEYDRTKDDHDSSLVLDLCNLATSLAAPAEDNHQEAKEARYQEAISLYEKAFAEFAKLPPDEDEGSLDDRIKAPLAGAAMNLPVLHGLLGASLVSRERYAEAEAEYRKALDAHQRFGAYPARLARVVSDLWNIGLVVMRQNRYEEAKGIFEQILHTFAELPTNADEYGEAKATADNAKTNLKYVEYMISKSRAA